MKKMWNSSILGLLAFVLPLSANAEQVSALEGTFYQSAKIYVVIAVSIVILIGIFAYLIATERKVTKLENELNNRK
jgi:hypothetical protein